MHQLPQQDELWTTSFPGECRPPNHFKKALLSIHVDRATAVAEIQLAGMVVKQHFQMAHWITIADQCIENLCDGNTRSTLPHPKPSIRLWDSNNELTNRQKHLDLGLVITLTLTRKEHTASILLKPRESLEYFAGSDVPSQKLHSARYYPGPKRNGHYDYAYAYAQNQNTVLIMRYWKIKLDCASRPTMREVAANRATVQTSWYCVIRTVFCTLAVAVFFFLARVVLPWQKKLRQPRVAEAQPCALSSMHAPVV